MTPAESEKLREVVETFEGRDGEVTKALYASLERRGPLGAIAVNLFRAQKSSSRAKEYRRRSSRGAAYDTKQWAMDNLARLLAAHADVAGLRWGWRHDPSQPYHSWVLYVDLPTGQVSFHTDRRGEGPDYVWNWDGMRDASPGRICRWAASLLAAEAETCPAST